MRQRRTNNVQPAGGTRALEDVASGSLDTSLATEFPKQLRAARLIPPRSRVLVALSGGLDSVVLLHLLRFRCATGLRVHAAHFDHAMRAGSAEDRCWVGGLCRAWDVPLAVETARASLRGEAQARRARYAFLEAAADRIGVDFIVTAHHADDQAETVLFRLLRGTGIHGLRGIPARRGRVIRPLLPFRRASIAQYAREYGLRHREDPTNRLVVYARNRIRHVLLPALEAIQPQVAAALVQLAAAATEVEALWEECAEPLMNRLLTTLNDGSLELARDLLLRYHPVVRARVLRRALHRLGGTPGRAGTRAALEFINAGAGGGVISLGGGVRIERAFDRLVLRRGELASAAADRPLVIREPRAGRGVAVIGGRSFAVRWSLSGEDADLNAVRFDPTGLRFPLELRGWRPGDRIRLGYGTKKLKKLFAERRVARGVRSRIPVLAEGGDRIIWVVGHARAAIAVPAADGPTFHITVENGEHG